MKIIYWTTCVLGFVGSSVGHHFGGGQCDTKSEPAFFLCKIHFMLNWVSRLNKLNNVHNVEKEQSNWTSLYIFFRLIRYLYPTDQELKTLARVPKEKPKKGKHAQENGFSSEVFHVPRNLDIELESSKVTEFDVVHLKYYTDYQWLLDFTVYSVIVYTLTEVYTLDVCIELFFINSFQVLVNLLFFIPQIYSSFYPLKNEINLSVLWCALVLGFALYPFQSIIIDKQFKNIL